jgi:Site-specific recombinase XerC
MRTRQDELEPIEPERALELYLKHKATECSEKTVQSHRYRLKNFVRWCERNDIENLNILSGRDLQAFRLWRQEDGDLGKLTLNKHMSTLRVFLKWCASIEAAPANLAEKIMIPRLRPEEQRREETLDTETAQDILDYLSTYQYASTEHTVFAVLWETGIRLGAANSLDVEDLDTTNRRLTLVHRPDQGTQLKTGAVASDRSRSRSNWQPFLTSTSTTDGHRGLTTTAVARYLPRRTGGCVARRYGDWCTESLRPASAMSGVRAVSMEPTSVQRQ